MEGTTYIICDLITGLFIHIDKELGQTETDLADKADKFKNLDKAKQFVNLLSARSGRDLSDFEIFDVKEKNKWMEKMLKYERPMEATTDLEDILARNVR